MEGDTAALEQTEQHLKLLSIFHYVVGGLLGLFSCMPIIHMVMGIIFIVSPESMGEGAPPPALFGWIFFIMGALFFLGGWSVAVCIILAGRFLSRRTHHTFCLVVAAVECIFMPFGTVLGVFTLIVLNKLEVKEMFQSGAHAH